MEKLIFGMQIMGMGMLIVFIGLIILIVAINRMGALLKRFTRDREDATASVESAPTTSLTTPLPVAPAAKVLEHNATGELATVAGLTALALAAGDSGKTFVVRAIRRVER